MQIHANQTGKFSMKAQKKMQNEDRALENKLNSKIATPNLSDEGPFPFKPLIFGSLAAAFEWYDYALFGYFATIIATQFFPNVDPTLAILSSFSVFATGFIMRPLGAVFFGYIGDRVGRKYALGSSLIMMALPTTLLSFLPTYEMIGFWAPVLLVILRLLQGLAVGGNYGGSFIFTIENAPQSKKGLAGSLASFGTLAGLLLGSGAATLLSSVLSEADMARFGWRIPFFFGILSGIIGLAIRNYVVEENPKVSNKSLEQSPIGDVIQNHSSALLKAITIILLDGVGIYINFVFMTTYATTFLKMATDYVMLINTVTMFILVATIPAFGYLTDIFRTKQLKKDPSCKKIKNPVLNFACLTYLLGSIPLFWWLVEGRSFEALWALQILFAIAMGAVYGSVPVTISQSFPRSIRYTASGLSFNLSVALFGGTSPLLATLLIHETGDFLIPAYILTFVGFLCFIVLRRIRNY